MIALATEGVITVVVIVDTDTGKLAEPPGFPGPRIPPRQGHLRRHRHTDRPANSRPGKASANPTNSSNSSLGPPGERGRGTSRRIRRTRRRPGRDVDRDPATVVTPSVSTLGSVPPGGHRWRRARYGSAPLASRVADGLQGSLTRSLRDGLRPPLTPGASAAPEIFMGLAERPRVDETRLVSSQGQETRAGRGPAPLDRQPRGTPSYSPAC